MEQNKRMQGGIDVILNPHAPTSAELKAALNVTLAVSESIRELGEVPSGTLYAALSCSDCHRNAVLNFHCARCGARFCSRYCLTIHTGWSACCERVPCAICGCIPIPDGKMHQNHALWCEVYKLYRSADALCSTLDSVRRSEVAQLSELGRLIEGGVR